jgi:uncharacterized repeat protein (TIGR03803 family)
LVLAIVLVSAVLATRPAQAQTFKVLYKVLYSFQGSPDGGDAVAPLVRDAKGNFYGTTNEGGTGGCLDYGCGIVFKVAPNGSETVLYSFQGSTDGAFPTAGLVRDTSGNLYGTTSWSWDYGPGTVFKLAPNGNFTVLYTFTGGADGEGPEGTLVRDAAGNFYGATYYGGSNACYDENQYGCGVVFKLTPSGKLRVLYTFAGYPTDGANPAAGLVRDAAGNLYGTTEHGGAYHDGVVFKLDKSGKETVLYSFQDGADGGFPAADLVLDAEGNLYGTTPEGGSSGCNGFGCGVVFKLDKAGKLTVLHSFAGYPKDGETPYAGLVMDTAGNLYGTTELGGSYGCFGTYGCGAIFRVNKAGKETVLYSFTGGDDGVQPFADLILDKAGNLYSTASFGGTGTWGTVFKLTPKHDGE